MPKIIEVAAIDATINAFVLPLMDRLRDSGFDVRVAAADTGFSEKLKDCGYTVHNIDFVRSLSPLGNIRALVQLIGLFRNEKPDIIHTHTPIASVLARIAARICGVPHVFYTLHGLKTQFPFLQIEKLACRYLTGHIFIINKTDLNFIRRECRIPRDRITILNGVGIDTCKFDPKNIDSNKKAALKKELQLDGRRVIGFVGRIVRDKGILTLIEAFAMLDEPKAKLLIVGSASLNERDSKTIHDVKRIVKRERLRSRIVFAGQRDDIPELLSLMDVFALPSYIEGMCVSTLEAMAMSVPVVATDIRGIREEVTSECGILVSPGDASALSEAIHHMLNSPKDAVKMGKKARHRVIRLFEEKRILDTQLDTFKRVLKL